MSSDLSPKAAEIAAVARQLLAARGYHGFSYADIAERVHISKPSIHHHYPSKLTLVCAVVDGYRAEARAGLETLQALGDAREQLGAYIGYWTHCLRERTLPICVCVMLASEMPGLPEEVALKVRQHFEEVSRWLASVMSRGAALGQLRLAAAPDIEARCFDAGIQGAMISARTFDDPEVFATVAAAQLARLVPSA